MKCPICGEPLRFVREDALKLSMGFTAPCKVWVCDNQKGQCASGETLVYAAALGGWSTATPSEESPSGDQM